MSVSYTHLDVYKRQVNGCTFSRCTTSTIAGFDILQIQTASVQRFNVALLLSLIHIYRDLYAKTDVR